MPKMYGQDDPPVGWPIVGDWGKFKRPFKGCSLPHCTEIIMQLMEAQELNPMEWYLNPDVVNSRLVLVKVQNETMLITLFDKIFGCSKELVC